MEESGTEHSSMCSLNFCFYIFKVYVLLAPDNLSLNNFEHNFKLQNMDRKTVKNALKLFSKLS